MPEAAGSHCPGCGLEMPTDPLARYDGYYHTSPECWSVYGEVLAFQYANQPVWGRAHQPVVDTYAVQHAGGPHPDKSVAVHLVGLHLAFDQRLPPTRIAGRLQHLAARVERWPHYPPPNVRAATTVLDVALATDQVDHVNRALDWAGEVWETWAVHHQAIAALATSHLG